MSVPATTERPILFSAPMVRAIIAGRKTQTRRVARPQPPTWATRVPEHGSGYFDPQKTLPSGVEQSCTLDAMVRCPFGGPGDRLWVKETWTTLSEIGRLGVCYEADGFEYRPDDTQTLEALPWDWWDSSRRRSSLHLPRRLSRIVLEVTAVRVERLQDISEADAQAEGVEPAEVIEERPEWVDVPRSYRGGFVSIWYDLHGTESWAANPWVWVVNFQLKEVKRERC